MVVERALTGCRASVQQSADVAGVHRHAHGVRDALTKWAGGYLDAFGVAVFRVPGGQAVLRTEAFEVIELEAVPDRKSWMYSVRLECPADRTNRSRPIQLGSVGS